MLSDQISKKLDIFVVAKSQILLRWHVVYTSYFIASKNSYNTVAKICYYLIQISSFLPLSLSLTFKQVSYTHPGVLRRMALVTTAEVCDANPQLIVSGELRALQPIYKIYGRRQVFSGPVVTLKVFEDNVLVREFLEEKGNGRVLVVDGGGSLRCAILGGNPVVQAQNNGWAGIVVNGCVRDVDEINGCDIGVRALASHPMKANKKGIGEKHVPITIAGTRICDGEWLYADTDGILISKMELSV
ncbi:putative 4-hydroxy-4-methyl-2-oxoglutarate aldolase 2 [Capsicum galapagoense]